MKALIRFCCLWSVTLSCFFSMARGEEDIAPEAVEVPEAAEVPEVPEAGRHRAARDWPENPRVFVIPVDQPIMQPQLFLLRRGVRRAIAEGADAIVLTMDTPGGRVDLMREIVNLIIDVGVPTYTLVERDAFSAGAIIALATDHVFMQPMTVIGDAMPIMMSPGGGMQELAEAEREKIEGAMDAIVRSIAQAKNRDERMLSAMVRRNLEYKLEDGRVISEAGQILTLTNIEAEQIKPDGTPLLSEGTVADLDEMLKIIGLAGAEIIREIPTWADGVAVFITTIAPILLTLALVLFYLEINSPGIGWMGGLAVTFFLIVMFGHNVAGLAGMEDILLVIIGMLLLMVEILVIPGFGLVGITGIFLMIWGLIQAMTIRYPGNPGDLPGMDSIGNLGPAISSLSASVIASLVLMAFFLRSFDKSRFVSKNLVLGETISGKGEAGGGSADLRGQRGRTVTALTPSGTAEINGKEMSVVSDGGYVDAGAPVEVINARGNRVVVALVTSLESNV